MSYKESETIELKEIVTDNLKKEIIAFANTNGGRIYIGIQDDGTIIGVNNPDTVALQVSNMVRDTIKPDITMFMHYHTINENGKFILYIDVQQGTHRPYYLAKKGLRPEGVYVRQGYSSVPATDDAIRAMIKATDGDHFEAMRSLNQSLTFNACAAEFAKRHIPFGPEQMQTLRLMDREGIYSNLGLLLSDQCSHSVKVAVFKEQHRIFSEIVMNLPVLYSHSSTIFTTLLTAATKRKPPLMGFCVLIHAIIQKPLSERHSSICWCIVIMPFVPAPPSASMMIVLSFYPLAD